MPSKFLSYQKLFVILALVNLTSAAIDPANPPESMRVTVNKGWPDPHIQSGPIFRT